tara:strand:+ start:168 stop:290 length:123 start_codon:yes stop_codon:yes gene_type:complete
LSLPEAVLVVLTLEQVEVLEVTGQLGMVKHLGEVLLLKLH